MDQPISLKILRIILLMTRGYKKMLKCFSNNIYGILTPTFMILTEIVFFLTKIIINYLLNHCKSLPSYNLEHLSVKRKLVKNTT